MADNYLAKVPGSKMAEKERNVLQDLWEEAKGSFARYGRRSGAQRDASLALLNQAVDPNTDPLTGVGMKALGLAGLVTHPLAFFPTREEWDQRLQAAGNDSRVSRSIGGFLSDLPNLIDPQMAAGGAATVAPAIFAGMMAKTADLNKLKQAEKLAELGHSAEDIHDMTGWFKGVDDKWRFEIDDSTSRISEMMRAASGNKEGARAGSVFMHPELYAAYPQLADTRITNAVPSGARGASYSGSVGVSDELPSWEAKSTLLHELQHEIQNIEGFAKGGNVAEFAFIPKEQAEEALWLKNYIEMEGGTEAGVKRFTESIGRAPDEKAVRAAVLPYDMLVGATNPQRAYSKLAGEVEPRNVQFRRGMTKQERAASFPLSTQDIPSDQQTLRGVPNAATRDEALQGLVGGADEGITAYHGSPHNFDRFELSDRTLGTGEGTQVYSPGLYFAGHEPVAQQYKNLAARKGHDAKMYQVKLDLSEKNMLDWDKPLSADSPAEFKDAINQIIRSHPEAREKFFEAYRNNEPGFVYFSTLSDLAKMGDIGKNDKFAMDAFNSAGIKGIRYLDRGSRDAGSGTYNYVVFDDKLITILKKYGIPMTAGAGGAMMVAGQDMPPEFANQFGGGT